MDESTPIVAESADRKSIDNHRQPRPGKNRRPSTGRHLSWDIIRVIAISEVVLFHATCVGPTTKPGIPAAPFAWTHPFGASALLVVSGYFAAVTIRRYRPGQWLVRRLARLLPAYLAAVVAVFTLMRVFAPDDMDLHHLTFGDVVGNLLLLQQLLPSIHFVDISYWTLPIQVGGFAAMALLARYRVIRGWGAIVVLWLVLLVPLVVRVLWMSHEPAAWLVMAIEGTGLTRAHLLVAGVAIWLWAQRRIGSVHLVAILGVALAAQKVHPPTDNSLVLLGVMFGLICLAARGPDWHVPGLGLTARPIRWIAGCSYGIYLVHQSIGYVIEARLAEYGVNPWWWLVAVIVSAVMLGWALTVWVERPAFGFLSRRVFPARDGIRA